MNIPLTLFFDCHSVSSIVKNRRISELVAKKTTISSEFSRTSWQENSCEKETDTSDKDECVSDQENTTHQNAPPSIAVRRNPDARHFLERCARFDFDARVFAVNATDTRGARLVGCGFRVGRSTAVRRRSNRRAHVRAATRVVGASG